MKGKVGPCLLVAAHSWNGLSCILKIPPRVAVIRNWCFTKGRFSHVRKIFCLGLGVSYSYKQNESSSVRYNGFTKKWHRMRKQFLVWSWCRLRKWPWHPRAWFWDWTGTAAGPTCHFVALASSLLLLSCAASTWIVGCGLSIAPTLCLGSSPSLYLGGGMGYYCKNLFLLLYCDGKIIKAGLQNLQWKVIEFFCSASACESSFEQLNSNCNGKKIDG